MREMLCLLLSITLLWGLVFAGGMPEALPLPPGRPSAWWGLLFPGLFSAPAEEDERVTFAWPLWETLVRLVRRNA